MSARQSCAPSKPNSRVTTPIEKKKRKKKPDRAEKKNQFKIEFTVRARHGRVMSIIVLNGRCWEYCENADKSARSIVVWIIDGQYWQWNYDCCATGMQITIVWHARNAKRNRNAETGRPKRRAAAGAERGRAGKSIYDLDITLYGRLRENSQQLSRAKFSKRFRCDSNNCGRLVRGWH